MGIVTIKSKSLTQGPYSLEDIVTIKSNYLDTLTQGPYSLEDIVTIKMN